jgi:glucose/arabinose dehydrogenase
VFIDHLNSPFGVALVGNDLYVAATDALLKFPYVPGETHISGPGVKVTDLPAGLQDLTPNPPLPPGSPAAGPA